MKAKTCVPIYTPDLFRSALRSILNLNHELCRLAALIDWRRFDEQFAELFPCTRRILNYWYMEASPNTVGYFKI